jgi:mycofactocin system creatininase family protein
VTGSWLGDLTSAELGSMRHRDPVLVVPLGATEQHGAHLPLATDTDIAIALCARLAERRDVVIAPAVPYGSSGEHAGFAGTLSIGQEATELLVLELGRSATDSFMRVLFVSAHGGNAEPIARAVERLRAEGRDVAVFSPHWRGHPHAGRPETAMQLAIDPARVDLARAEAGNQQPLATILPAMRRGGLAAVSPNGVLGDPAGATAAEGEALLAALTAELAALVDNWVIA